MLFSQGELTFTGKHTSCAVVTSSLWVGVGVSLATVSMKLNRKEPRVPQAHRHSFSTHRRLPQDGADGPAGRVLNLLGDSPHRSAQP